MATPTGRLLCRAVTQGLCAHADPNSRFSSFGKVSAMQPHTKLRSFLPLHFFRNAENPVFFMALNQRIDARSASVHGLLRAMVRQRYSFHAFPL